MKNPLRVRNHPRVHTLLLLAALVPVGAASAWQASSRPAQLVAVAPPPGVQFQQTVQQQQTRDQLQNSQLQQQLHQNVADMAKQPSATNASSQQQLDQAERAQADRDRAAQQAQLQRDQDAAQLPQPVPVPAHRGG